MPAPRGRLTRQQAIRDFRALHKRLARPPRASDFPHSLRRALHLHFGSLAEARRVARVPAPSLARKWSMDAVSRELRRVSRSGVVASARGLLDAGRQDLLVAIYVYVGSLVRARIMAGVPHPGRRQTDKQSWDEDLIIGEILDRHDKGHPIAYSKVEPRLVAAAVRYFGSWQTAIEAVGFDYDDVRLTRAAYERDELLDTVRDLAAKRPDLTLRELHELKFANQLRHMFGSLEAAARAAGLRAWPQRQSFPSLSKKAVTARLRARRRAGKSVYSNAVANDDPHLWRSALGHYQDWPQVLAAVRLRNDSPRRRTWSKQLVIERLGERQARGLSIRPRHVQRDDPSLYPSANNYFGSYRAAAKRVGVETARRRWTKERVIRELRETAAGQSRITAAQTPPALVGAAKDLFGKFSCACAAAGLEVHTKRTWTRNLVVDELRRLAQDGPVVKRRAGSSLEHACRRFFGGFSAARDAALR